MKATDWKQLSNLLESPDPEQLKLILAANSHEDAYARVDGVSRDTCRALRRLAAEVSSGTAAALQQATEKATSAKADADALEKLMRLSTHCRTGPEVKLPKPKLSGAGSHLATAHVTLTDVHTGIEIRKDMAYGLNEYNLEIERERLAIWAERTVKLYKLHAKHRTIPRLIVWGLGDFINNELHESDAAVACVLGPMEAAVWFTKAWSEALARIREALPVIDIDVVVIGGNHDRVTKRPDFTRGYATSYAMPIGYGLEATLSARFHWHRPTTEMLVIKTPDGMRIRGMHGHQFKYSKGVGGPEVPIRRALPLYDKIAPADCTVIGHFHGTRTPGDVLISGGFVGPTPWSMNMGFDPSPAEQLFFLTDSHYGLSAIHRMGLT